MKIEHIALWTRNLDKLKDFYIRYFNAQANDIYINEKTGFRSYFLKFDDNCRLEIMEKPSIKEQYSTEDGVGLSHFAVSVGSKDAVDNLTNLLRNDGFKVLREPRITGDGYYESVVSDPDGNLVEITI